MKQLITILLLTLTIVANEYKIGEKINHFNLKDQFTQEHNISKIPKIIVIAFEKESSYLFNVYMKNKNNDFLKKHDILFLADISQMPSFVTTSFALPRMRTYSYPVLLIYNENEASRYPYAEQRLTILKLDAGVIKSIGFASNLKELENDLK